MDQRVVLIHPPSPRFYNKRRNQMPTEAIAGMIGFGVFFTMWVVIPTVISKRHSAQQNEEGQAGPVPD
jgi:hypothetical protein